MYPPPSQDDPGESDRFYEWIFRLEREPRLDALLTEVLRFLVESTRASIVLLELFGAPDNRHTRAYGIDSTNPVELRDGISWSILGEALATKRIVETACAVDDARFADAGSVRRNEIQAVICVPIVEPGGRIVGVLYLQGRAPFGEAAREQMLALSHALANVVDRLRASEDPATYHRMVDAYALSLVSAAHRRNDFNAAAAARELGIDRKTFYRLRNARNTKP